MAHQKQAACEYSGGEHMFLKLVNAVDSGKRDPACCCNFLVWQGRASPILLVEERRIHIHSTANDTAAALDRERCSADPCGKETLQHSRI